MWRVTAYDGSGREIAQFDADAGEFTIGRDADRQIVLPSTAVSRRHARLVLDGPQPYVVDEGSANGVRVNGVKIAEPTAVVSGTRLQISEFTIDLYSLDAPQLDGASAAPMGPLRLVAVGGPFGGQSFEIQHTDLTLGRSSRNDLVLDDSSLSRKHCRIRRVGNQIELEDLGSSNGSFVNEEQINQGTAQIGDEIRFGELIFRLEGGGAESQIPASRRSQGPLLYAAIGLFALGVFAVVAILLWPSRKTEDGSADEIASQRIRAEMHLKAGKDSLMRKRYGSAVAEFEQVLRLDPANADARRLRALATSEPKNERLAKQVVAKANIGRDRSLFEQADALLASIPARSAARDPAARKLASRLAEFGLERCRAHKWLDCAWAICRARELAPEGAKPGADADEALKTAEKRLSRDRTYVPCKAK